MIAQFDGKNSFLSNFFPSPITVGGITFPTVENWFQAWKTEDPVQFKAIALADTPGKSKRLGRRCTLRKNWEEIKVDVMRDGLCLKFQDPKLRSKLLATGNKRLIEGNTWHDNFWGDCSCDRCKNIPGTNMLGTLLMELREEIRHKEET